MKVVGFKDTTVGTKGEAWKNKPILPLEPPVSRKMNRDEYEVFKLRTDPGDNTSPIYEKTLPYITGDEEPRAIIQFYKDFDSVVTGMNMVQNVAGQFGLARRMLRQQALTSFNLNAMTSKTTRIAALEKIQKEESLAAAENPAALAARLANVARGDHIDDIAAGIQGVMIYACPTKALEKTKRWMRRSCRKPADMRVRQYYNNLIRVNDELAYLPPFDRAQILQDDELHSIFIWGMPNSWTKNAQRLNLDIYEMDLPTVLTFFENQEETENKVPDKKESGSPQAKKQKHRSSNRDNDRDGKSCMIHGKNCGHSTEDCRTVKAKLRDDAGSKNDKYDRSQSKNKTWKRRDNKAEANLADIVNKAVKEAMRKEVNSISSKRKRDEDDDESTKSSDSSEVDPQEFNYADIDKQLADVDITDDDNESFASTQSN